MMSTHVPTKRRTTTGCLTCRVRRKKCDEIKPTCTGCRRNFVICTWSNGQRLQRKGTGHVGAVLIHSTTNSTTLACTRISNHAGEPQLMLAPAASTPPHPLGFMPGPRKSSDGPLLDHYLRVTSRQLAGRVKPRNPFLAYVIPVAYTDTAVFQSILALSGAQLCAKTSDYEQMALSHYAITLRSVKHKLVGWQDADSPALIALLTVTVMLCFYEVLIGDMRGNFFYHLGASRTLISELRTNRADEVDRATLDLLTELYAYMAITSNVTLHSDLTPSREIPQDSFLETAVLKSLNQGSDIHGSMFGAAHELYGLINPISHAARHWLKYPDDIKKKAQHDKFEKAILGWKYEPIDSPPSSPESVPEDRTRTKDAYELAGGIYQQCLLIYLWTMFAGTTPPTPAFIAKLDPYITHALNLCAALPKTSDIRSTMAWPFIITGACLREERHRAVLRHMGTSLTYSMMSVKRAHVFMGLLWDDMDEDESVFGPWGIERTIRKHGVHFCCAWTIGSLDT